MTKTRKISFKHFLLFFITTIYLTVCFMMAVEDNLSKYESYTEAIKSLKENSETIILNKFDMSSEEYLYSLRNHKVVADTLIYGLHTDERGNYLIAGIVNENDQRILFKLAVNSNVVENYSAIRYKKAILTAQIKDVFKLPYQKEILSFDNEIVWGNLKYDILLEGSLDELLYISPISG